MSAMPVSEFQRLGRIYITNAFQKLLGRDPTEVEIAQVYPFLGNERGSIHDVGSMESQVASIAQGELGRKQNQERLDKQVGDYQGSINDVFNSLMKRGATQAEIQHFGRLMANGDLDAYTLNQFVQSMPEYQSGQDKTMREGLSNELQGYDQKFFNQAKEGIIGRYAAAGRLGSSALDYALTDMLGKVADKRSEWLANLSAQQYGGNKENARADYMTSMNRMFGGQDQQMGFQNQLQQRSWDMTDYNKQQSDYENYLRQSQRQPNWMDYTNFGLNAANSISQTGRNFGLWGGGGAKSFMGATGA